MPASSRYLSWRATRSVVVLLAVFISLSAEAGARTLGWVEWALLLPDRISIKAKLDTGARTSSLHAVDIEAITVDGEHRVRFRVPLASRADDTDSDRDLLFERPVVRETLIKDHVAAPAPRYVVNLDLCIGGLTFTTPVTLTDRSRFNYPLLLGRSALQGRVLVDAARTFTARRSCKSPLS